MNVNELADRLDKPLGAPLFAEAAAMLRKQDAAIKQLREAVNELMTWQMKNVHKWHNPAHDNAHIALAATENL